jgi:hypothetical protein
MRIGPLFIAGVLYVWTFLAAQGWALTEIAMRREPSLMRLLSCLVAGAVGVEIAILAGGRGGLGLILTFPACFAAAVGACAIAPSVMRLLVRGARRGLR